MKITIEELADRFSAEQDSNYKDEWERGFDAGRMSAGRELKKLLEEA